MGKTFSTGLLTDGIAQDSSNNIGIGGAVNSSYKLTVTGATLTTGAATFSSSVTATEGIFSSGGVDGSLGAVVRISTTNTNGNARNWALVNTYESYGDLNFRVSTAQGGNALTTGSTVMTLTRSGYLGLGTAAPTGKLEIKGDGGTTGKTFRTTDSSGNETFVVQDGGTAYVRYGPLGIGTTSPTDNIIGSGTFVDVSSTTGGGVKLHYSPSSTYGELSLYKGSNGSYIDSAGASTVSNNDIVFRTGGTSSNFSVTERMRITNAGYVNIGYTFNQNYGKLNVLSVGSQLYNGITVYTADGTDSFIGMGCNNSTAGVNVTYGSTGTYLPFVVITGGSERMRITSGGVLLVANSSSTGGYDHSFNNVSASNGTIVFNQTSGATLPCAGYWNNATSGDNVFQRFFVNTGGNLVGSIDYNRSGGATRYNTTSDANLKNIIGNSDLQKSIDILNSTKIREYSWKDDETNKTQIGVIAQELYQTYKGAVSKGSDDELFGTEDYKTWGVDKTAFTFHLIAGWQMHEKLIKEQQEVINQLSAKVTALENQS